MPRKPKPTAQPASTPAAGPQYWLLKTEPGEWSWSDQARAAGGTAPWDGVRNRQAINYLRAMRSGDQCLFYHSGAGAASRRVVGVVEVARPWYEEEREGEKAAAGGAVDVRAVGEFRKPVALGEIKKAADEVEGMRDFALLRQPRLSVMPVPAKGNLYNYYVVLLWNPFGLQVQGVKKSGPIFLPPLLTHPVVAATPATARLCASAYLATSPSPHLAFASIYRRGSTQHALEALTSRFFSCPVVRLGVRRSSSMTDPASSSSSAPMAEGGSINDDLHLQGEHGDDEDAAAITDAADALFRMSASTPVDIDASPTTSTAAGNRTRARTSGIWNDMEELKTIVAHESTKNIISGSIVATSTKKATWSGGWHACLGS
ncbi:hypothetical protein PR202_ga13669 [Eleusine coracana subsp. coracana]|uniref:EVE domain-containing protein n=1 Tax=Eleusine coracana subsp. coracana TaxID=191504 RepID=A0AAV5CEM0_ELECO|nr:hypothetical protein PR202_ga13669 [Eleusine coracana subsp. coracana]